MSRQKTPCRKPGAERLGAGLLGGEPLGVGGGAVRARRSDLARSTSVKTRAREAVAEARQRRLDAADVDDVVADAEDHGAAMGRLRLGARLIHERPHVPDGRVQPAEDRLADQEMADIEFDDLRACAPRGATVL